ncbi:MAG: PVC-type heme-binding CxxCH protein, partial [Planctomycetota bacterium]
MRAFTRLCCPVSCLLFCFVIPASAQTPPAARLNHADLSVYLDDSGLLAPVRSPDDWQRRRRQILQGMQDAMGPLPPQTELPFAAQVTEERMIGAVRRVTLSIVVEGTGRLPFDLYLPAALAENIPAAALVGDTATLPAPARLPAILALHPTGEAGKRIVAGEAGKAGRQYAIELAQRGYIVAAPDYPSFGDLKDYDFAADTYISGTMKAIVNHRRCTDFLASLPFVDAERLGVIGHSLGGHNAIFQAVFDPRLKAVISSCGWCPFGDYYGGNITGWTSDRYMPLLKTRYNLDVAQLPFDFYELIAALAPRTFVSVSPVADGNFDVQGVRKAIPVASTIYSLHNARENLVLLTPDCGHDFPADIRLQVYGIIDRTLNHKPDAFDPDYSLELPRIAPTAPADALSTFDVLPGFELQQTAAEPLVTDPVAISYDADGRLYVVEMRDYSEQDREHLGVIRLLIDTDQDGRFDDSHEFARGLSWPTAIIAAEGGIFVAAAPDVFFLKDTDGDLKADVQEVVFTGFHRTNVQGLINSFHWGPDNRIYGSASTVGGSITSPRHPARPAVECRGRDFSFNPKTLELRAETGGGQHGMSFDNWGHRFVSANSDHAQLVIYADRYLARSPLASPAPARISIAADGGQAPVFRISPVEPWRIVRTRLRASGLSKGLVEGGGRPAGYFTGATGITIYRGDAWPAELSGIAIIGDVGSNIVHRKKLTPTGVIWSAERMDPGRELVASRDIWFRPVQYANAPDGCLHILDMYREVIEHPASLPPEIKKHLDLTSGRDRGRLYRLAPTGWTYRPSPQLSKATTAELTALLEHPNAWHRDTATRLLYERQDPSAGPLLKTLLRSSKQPLARFHSIAALEGLAALTADDILIVLADPSPEIRERAILAAEAFHDIPAVQQALYAMAGEAAPRTLMQLAFTLGELPESPERLKALSRILSQAGGDRWIRTAVLSSLGSSAPGALIAVARQAAQPGAAAALPELADLTARRTPPGDPLTVFRETLTAATGLPTLQVRLLQAAATANPALASRPEFKDLTTTLVTSARTSLEQPANPEDQAAAIRVLSLSSWSASRDLLLPRLEPTIAPGVQSAALDVVSGFADAEIAGELIERLPSMSPALVPKARESLLRRPAWATAFLDAITAGTL